MSTENEQRAEIAFRTVLVYGQYKGQEDEDIASNIIDLSADLLHLCGQYGIEVEDLQRISLSHFHAEQREGVASER